MMKLQDMRIDNKTLAYNDLGRSNPDVEETPFALSREVKEGVDVHAKWQRQGFSGKV